MRWQYVCTVKPDVGGGSRNAPSPVTRSYYLAAAIVDDTDGRQLTVRRPCPAARVLAIGTLPFRQGLASHRPLNMSWKERPTYMHVRGQGLGSSISSLIHLPRCVPSVDRVAFAPHDGHHDAVGFRS